MTETPAPARSSLVAQGPYAPISLKTASLVLSNIPSFKFYTLILHDKNVGVQGVQVLTQEDVDLMVHSVGDDYLAVFIAENPGTITFRRLDGGHFTVVPGEPSYTCWGFGG